MNFEIDPSNIDFIEELYQDYLNDPASVSPEWKRYFETSAPARGAQDEVLYAYKQSRVTSLVWGYRDVGYLHAKINPLEGYLPKELEYVFKTIEGNYETLTLKEFGLEEDDLDIVFSSGGKLEPSRAPLRRILDVLKETYCSFLGVEILHIQNKPIRKWLINRIETGNNRPMLTMEQKKRVQKDLIKALEFEKFLHTKFVGQKRFSLEGAEVILPALHYLIDTAAGNGIEEIVIGMSHRGRLNTLVNIMGKPAEQIFRNFDPGDESPDYGESGDVRYHLGYSRDHENADGTKIHVSLVANPSHLESVDPVVQGKARGIQRRRGDKTRKKVVPVLLHGDAAFSGQGVVSETFNLSKLRGYETGGTIHIIVNNQIGFTTAARDLRSTFFPTDSAKALPVPIFHVNGNRPEYVVHAIDLALKFRQKFGYDAIVDVLCYRKFGHNEADDPSFTHPVMYNLINDSPGVTALFGKQLSEKGIFTLEEQDEYRKAYISILNSSLEKAKKQQVSEVRDAYKEGEWKGFLRDYSHDPVPTGVSNEAIRVVTEKGMTIPEGMVIHPKLERIIKGRKKMLQEGQAVDWATGEMLAFGSLLMEGTPIRLSGEDSGRGTFSHRHAVWWDVSSAQPKPYIPLNQLSPDQARFAVYDSPLSEFSVLGFELGNSLAQPKMLCLWEAQFGDFCNGAQVIIDQFVSASEVKWDRSTGLVMLLPHGYEGQGPEHSSAFLERFLQLCAQDNIQVCNATTPAQYFHLLRRQIHREFRKPLIIMSPKSLLRHKQAVSTLDSFTRGGFQEVLDDPDKPDSPAVVLCSGKIYYELAAAEGKGNTPIVRIEQLYPFPKQQLEAVLSGYPGLKEIRWVQEESRNRGGWTFMREHLPEATSLPVRYVGRPPSASPATGSYIHHVREQQAIIEAALRK